MKAALTDRQIDVMGFIVGFVRTQGMPPTRVEIAQFFGFKSPNAAQEHLKALEKKGYIALKSGFARAIRVLP